MRNYIHIMTFVPGPLDYALVGLLLVMLPLDAWLSGSLRRRLAAGEHHLRVRAYLVFIGAGWTIGLAVLALWIATGRPWGGLLLGAAPPLRLAAGAFAAALCLIPAINMRKKTERAVRLHGRGKVKLGALESLLPHTPREYVLWMLVSITAGVCEEIVFRGFLLAFIAHFAGIAAAIVLSAIIFGLGHAYQGKNNIFATGIWGLAAAIIAVASGSLVPVIVLHVLQDALMGDLAYRVIAGRTEYAAARVVEPVSS
jgi:hypothetical protein